MFGVRRYNRVTGLISPYLPGPITPLVAGRFLAFDPRRTQESVYDLQKARDELLACEGHLQATGMVAVGWWFRKQGRTHPVEVGSLSSHFFTGLYNIYIYISDGCLGFPPSTVGKIWVEDYGVLNWR